MDLSFVIVNYNTTALTQACVQSIYHFTKQNTFEVILVDNASSDSSIKNLTDQYPDIIFIQNNANLGFGKANNKGIEVSLGKYVFLLNSDAQLTGDAAFSFFSFMEAQVNQKVACCGGALIDARGNAQISYGNFPSLKEAFSALGFLRLYPTYYKRHLSSGVFNYSDEPRSVDYICGAGMFLRKDTLNLTGNFDPDFFLYYEEAELSLRIKRAGHTSIILPQVRIIHHEGASLGGSGLNLRKLEHYAKSRKLYFKKSHGNIVSMMINKIYALQALVFFVTKRNRDYLKSAILLFKA